VSDHKDPSDNAAGKANDIPRRGFLLAAGTAVASGAASTLPAEAQSPTALARPGAAPADFIFANGKIITVDAAFTVATGIAVAGSRILAVGPDETMARYAGPGTRLVDLKGRAVIPGIIDGLAHMDREGLRNVFPSLGRVRSISDIQSRIAELARGKAPGEWIVTMPIGDPPYYFDVPEILAEKRWPTRQELDAAAPRNPVFIRSIWGYWRGTFPLVSIANTEALRLAGITRDTVPPAPTLTIEKDARGDPTGVLIEREMVPIAELIWFRAQAGFSHADRVKALRESVRAYHAFATTSVFEGHGASTELLNVYKECLRGGTLSMRATLAFSPDWHAAAGAPLAHFVPAWAGWLAEPGLGNEWLMRGIFSQDFSRL
jgi:predicted amidohydrolase YtcJ